MKIFEKIFRLLHLAACLLLICFSIALLQHSADRRERYAVKDYYSARQSFKRGWLEMGILETKFHAQWLDMYRDVSIWKSLPDMRGLLP